MKLCKIDNCTRPRGFAHKGMCLYHYSQQYKSKSYKSNVKTKRNAVTGETQGQFLFKVLEDITPHCQCCRVELKQKLISNCAHILEKSRESFFIISNNPKNIVYLCEDCHHRFDNKGKEWFTSQETAFKSLISERITYLSKLLSEAQKTHIKEYLINGK